jgi:RHS repeat-associated protein
VPQGVRIYVYDEASRLLGEYDELGRARTEHVWLGNGSNGRPLAVIQYEYTGASATPDSTTILYVEADHLGTPRRIADSQNRTRWTWVSAPYGDTLPDEDPVSLGPVTYNLRFAGQYFDRETNLHYNHHRDYDATTGRYVQSDPIGLAGGINTYSYVGNSPFASVDPFGLFDLLDPADWPSIPQPVVDGVTGFGDAFLIPQLVRQWRGIDGGIDECSQTYRGARVVGFVWGGVPLVLRGSAMLGGTGIGHIVNHNRYIRFGPGRWGGDMVPRVSGPYLPGDGHYRLTTRIPFVPPLGGPVACGCP